MYSNLNKQMKFKSPTVLANWLVAKGVDLSQWGQASAKSVEDLWHEIINHDMVIDEDPLLRVVEVVTVIIRDGERVLIETAQQFKDGRRRSRNRPPSDKIKLGENYREAAIRCLDEELGIVSEQVQIMTNTHHVTQMVRQGVSYPGLPTQYYLHRVEAKVSHLPKHDFRTTESTRSGRTDPVKYHYWSWLKVSDEVIG